MNKLFRPQTYEELTSILESQTEKYLYYSGGTEVMSDYRQGKIKEKQWIDIKHLPGMMEQSPETIGACVFLNQLTQPAMLAEVAQGIADHTIRNHLTIGGNVCGKLPFREIVLPLLALDAEISIFSDGEIIRVPLKERFDKFLKLQPGELVTGFHFDRTERPYHYKRHTITGSIDYPLMTYLAVRTEQGYFVGLSGYGSIPQFAWFENWDVEEILNSFKAVSNDRGSADYRKKLLEIKLEKGAPNEAV